MKTVTNVIKLLTCTLLTLPVISVPSLKAQDYYINFSGSGVSSTIDSVIVENLTQGTKLTLKGTDILHLVKGTTGIETISGNVPGKIKFYPNPMRDKARMEFDLPEPGETMISMFDLAGRKIADTRNFLSPGRQTYLIEGVKEGLYIVRIISGRHSCSGKLICSGSQNIGPKIVHENTENVVRIIVREEKSDDSKGFAGEIEMPYNTLDQLKFIGFSGNSSTVSTDVPDASTTVGFEFDRCTDADHNNYSTVRIGTQVWMAENLRTTKYRDGTIIPLVGDNSGWDLLTIPAFCFYDNLLDNRIIYGALYNWYAAASDQVCPLGWHVPGDDDWTVLTDYLGGLNIAGGILKESGTLHWLDPNNGATNESGFTALPGGRRDKNGLYASLGENTDWWSATESSTGEAFFRSINNNATSVLRSAQFKQAGASIRCLKDTLSAGTIRDYDGNLYTTVKIGDQEWMKENLKTTHYNDGIPIPLVTDASSWENLTSPGYCWYDNDETTYKTNYYGALYNWHAANTSTLCPVGWHVPTETDWNILTDYLGNIIEAGGKMKQGGTVNWLSPNTGATNESGFTALPGGYRGDPDSGGGFIFNSLHEYGYFWSSTSNNNATGNIRILGYNSSGITGGDYNRADGASVRCMKDNTSLENVKDYDGNIYTTVVLGNQVWMKENLKTKHYKDGTAIPLVTDDAVWSNLYTPGYCWYDNEESNYKNYTGALYNWYTINTGNICPSGWHVPDENEFEELIRYIGDNAGGKLKDFPSSWWESPNTGATNKSGFTALAGGLRDDSGAFSDIRKTSGMWVSGMDPWISINGESPAVEYIRITYISDYCALGASLRRYGFSVRCLKDYFPNKVYDIDRHEYPAIKIGNQVWMGENLKTILFNDGTSIQRVLDATEWNNLNTPGCTWYDNDFNYYFEEYGTLYNWYAVNDGKLCPVGWRVPSDSDWSILTDYLGGESLAGGVLKEEGTTNWESPNTGATNQTGFAALPGGYRDIIGGYNDWGTSGYWWSNSLSGEDVLSRIISYNSTSVTGNSRDKRTGMSVRCIQGNEPETVYDLDGYTYPVVYIGNQIWMGENLKTTRLRDGTAIQLVTDNTAWHDLTKPGYCWYDNNEGSNKYIYGALYNWHTVNTHKLCPEGWHVPSDEDWATLTTFFGGESLAGGALKETGTANWNSPNKTSNESGFTARPGGWRDTGGGFYGIGDYGHWWSSTETYEINAYLRIMIFSNFNVTRTWNSKGEGKSVRCLKNPPGTVEDYDGNFYTTDTIGIQIWMGENLKTTHYNDGTPIPLVPDGTEWQNLSSPGYCWYDNDDSNNKFTYGALYNWHTVNTGKLCPEGWRIPTYLDWKTLSAHLEGDAVSGGKMKESGTTHWASPNTGASNISGFSALPAGQRSSVGGLFRNITLIGSWWTQTVDPVYEMNAWSTSTYYDDLRLEVNTTTHKNTGLSVRCVLDK